MSGLISDLSAAAFVFSYRWVSFPISAVMAAAQTVQLKLGDDSIQAEVRWALSGAAGLRLTNPDAEGSWVSGRG